MVTKLELYNIAARHVGATRFANVSEDRSDRRELDAVYDHALDTFLEKGVWKFALRTIRMDPDPDITPAFGLRYAYSKPEDFKRLHAFASDPYLESEIRDYREEAGYWYTDNAEVYLSYVSNHPTRGMNMGAYPAHYSEALGAEMAKLAALPISKSAGDRNDLFAIAAGTLRDAKKYDAIDERVKTRPTGRLVRSRIGNGRATYNGRW